MLEREKTLRPEVERYANERLAGLVNIFYVLFPINFFFHYDIPVIFQFLLNNSALFKA